MAYICPRCGAVSHNPHDEANRYCGRCHKFEEDDELLKEDAKVKSDLGKLARLVDSQLPYGWGFVVLAFPFGEGGRMNYISNVGRPDVVRSMYEFIEATREKWSEHIGEAGSGADDEQLARARQALSELRRLLARAADALEKYTGYPIGMAMSVSLRESGRSILAELRKAAE